MAAQHAVHQPHGAIDASLLIVVTHNLVDISHMVLMVVGEDHTLDCVTANAIAPQLVKHVLRVDASINEHAVLRRADVGAVAAAAAAKADECQSRA